MDGQPLDLNSPFANMSESTQGMLLIGGFILVGYLLLIELPKSASSGRKRKVLSLRKKAGEYETEAARIEEWERRQGYGPTPERGNDYLLGRTQRGEDVGG